jgi:hypothetical protein
MTALSFLLRSLTRCRHNPIRNNIADVARQQYPANSNHATLANTTITLFKTINPIPPINVLTVPMTILLSKNLMPAFFMFKNLGVRVAHLRCATLLLFAAKIQRFEKKNELFLKKMKEKFANRKIVINY